MQKAIIKLCQILAAVATLIAINGMNSTCFFFAYQPDMPEKYAVMQKKGGNMMHEDLEIGPPIGKGFLFLWIGSGKSCESKG